MEANQDYGKILEIVLDLRSLVVQLVEFSVGDRIRDYIGLSEMRGQVLDLCDGKRSVKQIVSSMGKPQPMVSACIAGLEQMGLLRESKHDGRLTYYTHVRG